MPTVRVYACVRQSSLQLLRSLTTSQGYFSDNTSGRRPVWNLLGLPTRMIDVGHGFP